MKVYKPTMLAFGLGLSPVGAILILFTDVDFYIGSIILDAGAVLVGEAFRKPNAVKQ